MNILALFGRLREMPKSTLAAIVEASSVTVPLLGAGLSEADMAKAACVVETLRQSLDSLCHHFEARSQGHGPTFSLISG